MTHVEFNNLSHESQAEIICKKGISLGERQTSIFEIFLYQVDGFYVEVYYHKKENTNLFKSFDNTDMLFPYLRKINVVDLLKV